jgi:glycosidase
VIESIGFGTSQVDPGTFRVHLLPGEHLTVGMGATATTASELAGAQAFVWTNYGSEDPSSFRAIAMTPAPPSDHHQVAFTHTLGPARVGTFIATAFLEIAGSQSWAQDYTAGYENGAQYGLQNRLVFRVSAPFVQHLNVREVPIDKANARSDSTDISLIEDLLDPDPNWYTLKTLRDGGVNCVWFQVPYRLDPWDGRDTHDDAGSDYATNDWFSVDPDLSHDARAVPPWDLDLQHRLANTAMKRLVQQAHALNMKVLMEIAPNHVGHNFIYRDVTPGAGGVSVPRRDYSLSAVDAAQLAQINERLNSSEYTEEQKNFAEYMLPQMYAAHYPDGTYNPYGASSVYETYSPDWYGLWADVKHLNHGGHAGFQIWVPSTPQNYRVLEYIGRAMAWAATEIGVDGFRIDHALGMPFHFFEQTLPWVEMKVREQRGPDATMIWAPEDHNRKDYTSCVADVIQSMGYMDVLRALAAQDIDRVWGSVSAVESMHEFLATGNHDEHRGIEFFGGDVLAFGNAIITMELLGGPVLTLAGDEYGERQQLHFKSKGGIPTVWQRRQGLLPIPSETLAYWVGRGAQLADSAPALQGTRRERLHRTGPGAAFTRILAWSRSSPNSADAPLLIVSNLERSVWAEGTFSLGESARAWLTPQATEYFQVRDLMGFDPDRYLWSRPLQGSQLLETGLGVGLQPSQIQALRLERIA